MIPIADLAKQNSSLREELARAISETMLRGEFVLGRRAAEFEDAFAAYCGTDFGVGVNSGTSALHLALLAAGLGPGDEVIAPALIRRLFTGFAADALARTKDSEITGHFFRVFIERTQIACPAQTLLPRHVVEGTGPFGNYSCQDFDYYLRVTCQAACRVAANSALSSGLCKHFPSCGRTPEARVWKIGHAWTPAVLPYFIAIWIPQPLIAPGYRMLQRLRSLFNWVV